jgi:hypothetical protein
MLHPILLVSVPGFLSIVGTLASPLAFWGIKRLRSRARARNRQGRCGACSAALPFSADPDDLPVAAGIFLCERCAHRWRRRINASFVVMPLFLTALASTAALGILASNMWPGYWMSTRLVVVVWPTLSSALAWGLTLRAIRRANRDQQLPAYDSVTQALDEIRERRDLLALPGI